MRRPRIRFSPVWLPVLFTGLLALWLSLSTAGRGARAAAELPTGLEASWLFPSTEGGAYFLCGDGGSAWACHFSGPDQEAPASAALASPPSLVYGENGKLCLFYAYDGFGTLLALDPELDLGEAEGNAALFFTSLPASYACGEGWLYVEDQEGVAAFPPDGGEALSLPVRGRLYTAPDGQAFAWGEGLLYRLSGGEAEALSGEEPRLFLGGGAYLSVEGTIFRLTETGAELVMAADPALRYWGGSALLAFGGSRVTAYGWDGLPAGSYEAGGEVAAVSQDFALVKTSGGFRLVAHDFQPDPTPAPTPDQEPSPAPTPEEEPSPTPVPTPYPSPSPTPSPSPSPESSPWPTPPVEVQGSWLYVPPGTTLETLRQLFWPDPVTFYNMQGAVVTEGLAGTGMTARKYTLVVPGDGNGDGRVDQRDMDAGLELLLRNQREGPQALALDLDGDEILTLKDLVLFSQRLEGAAP